MLKRKNLFLVFCLIGLLFGLGASVIAVQYRVVIQALYDDPNDQTGIEVIKPDSASSTVLMSDDSTTYGLKFDNYTDDWRMKNASTTERFVTTSSLATSTILNKGVTVGIIDASSTVATSTFANGIQISQGKCYFTVNDRCAITGTLTNGFSVSESVYIHASTTNVKNNIFQDIYTVPTGRRGLVYGMVGATIDPTGTTNYAPYLKTSGGTRFQLTATSSVGVVTPSNESVVGFILEAGESLSLLFATSTQSSIQAWVTIQEFSNYSGAFTKYVTNPAVNSTTTLYTVPINKSAKILPRTISDAQSSNNNAFLIMNSDATAKLSSWYVTPPNTVASTSNAVRKNVLASPGAQTGIIFQQTLTSGYSIQMSHGSAAATGAGEILWVNINEY